MRPLVREQHLLGDAHVDPALAVVGPLGHVLHAVDSRHVAVAEPEAVGGLEVEHAVDEALLAGQRDGRAPRRRRCAFASFPLCIEYAKAPSRRTSASGNVDVVGDAVAVEGAALDRAHAVDGIDQQVGRDAVAAAVDDRGVDEREAVVGLRHRRRRGPRRGAASTGPGGNLPPASQSGTSRVVCRSPRAPRRTGGGSVLPRSQ